MPTEEKMTVNERRKYLKLMKPRYERARRAERTHLLDEMEVVTGMHRKSLTRLLHEDSLERRPRRAQRVQSYGLEVERVVIRVWESLDYVCAERLTPALWPTAQHLARFGVLRLTRGLSISGPENNDKQLLALVRTAFSLKKRKRSGDTRGSSSLYLKCSHYQAA